jgi:electron transport complex protein RnfA
LNSFIRPHAPYLRLLAFIVVIASTVQFVEMAINDLSPAPFRALGDMSIIMGWRLRTATKVPL